MIAVTVTSPGVDEVETGETGLDEAGTVDVATVLVVITLGVVKTVVDPEVVNVWPTGQVVT